MTESKPIPEETDKLLGDDLINLLSLRVKRNGRVDTSGGDKTPLGLARTVRRVVNESAPDLLAENERLRSQLAELREAAEEIVVECGLETCPVCRGSGLRNQAADDACPYCGGSGEASHQPFSETVKSLRAALARSEGEE